MLGCNLGLDVRHFGVIFGKRKRMTTNPATRPFWVFVGSGMDVREKFGKSEVAEVMAVECYK